MGVREKRERGWVKSVAGISMGNKGVMESGMGSEERREGERGTFL